MKNKISVWKFCCYVSFWHYQWMLTVIQVLASTSQTVFRPWNRFLLTKVKLSSFSSYFQRLSFQTWNRRFSHVCKQLKLSMTSHLWACATPQFLITITFGYKNNLFQIKLFCISVSGSNWSPLIERERTFDLELNHFRVESFH